MSGIFQSYPAVALPLTGSETVPADTQQAQGIAPETVLISVAKIKLFALPPVALTDAATIALDASLGDLYTVTLGGNRTLANPTNLVAGKVFRVEVTQDGTGARTLAYGSLYKFSGSSTLTTSISQIDMLTFVYDGTIILGSLQAKFA